MSLRQRVPLELLLLLACWLWIFPYSQTLNNPNERTRVLQARALVESGSLHIGRIERRGRRLVSIDTYGDMHRYDARRGVAFVNDVALVCDEPLQSPPNCVGTIYPAKPPGAALLGVPALFLAERLGWVETGSAGEPQATWVVRYGGVLPLIGFGLWALMYLLARSGAPSGLRRCLLLCTALGTGIMPYGLMAVGHAAAGAALLGSLALLVMADTVQQKPGAGSLTVVAGHIAGWAVLLEYHSAIGVLALTLWILFARREGPLNRATSVTAFGVGGAAAAAVFGLIHHSAFGAPWKTGHAYLMSSHNRASQADGFLGMDGFHLDALMDHLMNPYMGLAPMMSWLLLGLLLSPVFIWVRSRPLPKGYSAMMGVACLYLLFVSSLGQWKTMNGWSIGPRYLAPAMFPMAYLAGLIWVFAKERSRLFSALFVGTAAASIVMVGLTVAAYPSPPNSVLNTFSELVLPILDAGYGVRTFGAILQLGPPALAPFFIMLSVAVALTVVAAGGQANDDGLATSYTALLTGFVCSAMLLSIAPNAPTLVLIASVPVALVIAVWLDPLCTHIDRSAAWAPLLLAASILTYAVFAMTGALDGWLERLTFGAPGFMPVILVAVIIVGRLRATVLDATGRSAVLLAMAVATLLIAGVAAHTPTDVTAKEGAQAFCKQTVEGLRPDARARFLGP